ncbi:MAG: hypothetical protein R3D80_05640 [Paracoccaceae bacterium]
MLSASASLGWFETILTTSMLSLADPLSVEQVAHAMVELRDQDEHFSCARPRV